MWLLLSTSWASPALISVRLYGFFLWFLAFIKRKNSPKCDLFPPCCLFKSAPQSDGNWRAVIFCALPVHSSLPVISEVWGDLSMLIAVTSELRASVVQHCALVSSPERSWGWCSQGDPWSPGKIIPGFAILHILCSSQVKHKMHFSLRSEQVCVALAFQWIKSTRKSVNSGSGSTCLIIQLNPKVKQNSFIKDRKLLRNPLCGAI